MKLSITLTAFTLFLLCLFPTRSFAQEASNPTPKRASASFTDGLYRYKLSDQDLENTPSWKEGVGELPLSVQEAVRVARINLPRFVENAATWKVRKIDLNNMIDDKWYYTVFFICAGKQCKESQMTFMSIVKMDGTIIEPKKIVEQ